MAYWISFFITVVIIYVVISVAIYYLQDYLLFKPEKLPEDFQFYYENQDIKEYNLETRDGAVINALLFKPKGESKGIVFYLKGNSKSIKGWGKFAVDFTRHNYNVLMVDYRGFGKSTGRRSQKAIKRDLQEVYNKLKERTPEDRIILYGRSLGSGFAAKLASINNPRLLVLDAPYYSLTKVTGRYMPFMPLSLLLKYPLVPPWATGAQRFLPSICANLRPRFEADRLGNSPSRDPAVAQPTASFHQWRGSFPARPFCFWIFLIRGGSPRLVYAPSPMACARDARLRR